MEDILILIPAAGASSRMRGGDKLLEEVEGEPVLRRTARIARAAGARVLVTLPEGGPRAAPRRAVLAGLDLRSVAIADAHEGMAASLRAGAAAAGAAALMIMLPDMPDITGEDLHRMIARFREEPGRPLRATSADGTVEGHPVILPRHLLQKVSTLSGDRGARQLLSAEDVVRVALPGRHALTDLDTPEDWAAWRAARI